MSYVIRPGDDGFLVVNVYGEDPDHGPYPTRQEALERIASLTWSTVEEIEAADARGNLDEHPVDAP